ncbi:MAG: hypothetical protein WA797_05145 [Acidimicrobiales bacterium]
MTAGVGLRLATSTRGSSGSGATVGWAPFGGSPVSVHGIVAGMMESLPHRQRFAVAILTRAANAAIGFVYLDVVDACFAALHVAVIVELPVLIAI